VQLHQLENSPICLIMFDKTEFTQSQIRCALGYFIVMPSYVSHRIQVDSGAFKMHRELHDCILTSNLWQKVHEVWCDIVVNL